jgi:uncharacterized RDD family membrane protein YckC
LGKRLEALAITPVLIVGTLGVGWLAWSVVEWRNGRTPSYRRLGLRVVRCSDGRPIGLFRSLVRSGLCCTLLVIPTVVIGAIIGACFALGASPPDGLLRQPRRAPWDFLTSTMVVDERAGTSSDLLLGTVVIDPITLAASTSSPRARQNGHH